LSDYLDTSVLIAALSNEVRTGEMSAWLASRDSLLVSSWNATEFASALSLKMRAGTIVEADREAARRGFDLLIRDTLAQVSVIPEDFEKAAQFASAHALRLRGGDALHLAIAARAGATLCTLDKRQAEAGAALGVATLLL
jgi:predicted nucleic acid-binding protein